MPTLVMFADASDGYIVSFSTSNYATARSGSGLTMSAGYCMVGQDRVGSERDCGEAFLSFDSTGVLDASHTVSNPILDVVASADSSTQDFIIQARARDFGATLTTADWVAGDSLAALPLLASLDTSAGISTIVYNTFTSQAGFADAVVKGGPTRMLLCSERMATGSGTEPTTHEYLNLRFSETAGTSQDPRLTVTYSAPAASLDVPLGNGQKVGHARALWASGVHQEA